MVIGLDVGQSEKFLHHGHLSLNTRGNASLARLAAFFKIYIGASPVDRTETITFPTAMKSIFPLPEMRAFSSTYAEVCEQRALGIVKLASDMDVGIYAFWSGGIDSTLVLTQLLKHCEPDRLTILLNEDSIQEYPLFFSHYLRKLRRQPASRITEVFTENAIVVNGEANDQLFGSDVIGKAVALFGMETVVGSLKREVITSLYQHLGASIDDTRYARQFASREDALFFSELFWRLIETAPVDLVTNFDFLWWVNFVLKWQTVYMRPLIFSRDQLSAEHVKIYYQPFFHTPEFELWSMNNMDKRIKNDWRSYKWPCKELIYEFTGDEDYRCNKVKHGSLRGVIEVLQFNKFIDEDFAFREEMAWYQPSDLD